MKPRRARAILLVVCSALPALASGCADLRIAPSYPGTIFLVAEEGTPALAEIEPNGGNVRWRYPTLGPAVAVAVSRNGQYAATIEPSGQVVVHDLQQRRQDASFRVVGTGRPTGLVFSDRRSTLLASFDGSGELLAFARSSGRVERVIATGGGGVHGLFLAPDGKSALALCDGPAGIVAIDLERMQAGPLASTESRATSVTAHDANRGRWTTFQGSGDVAYRRSPAESDVRIAIGPPPLFVASDVEGGHVAVSCAATGELVLLDASGTAIAARVRVGAPASDRAWPVLVDPIGKNAYVGVPGEDRVVVVDPGSRTVRGAYALGDRPGAIAWAFQRLPPEVGGVDVSR
jgi:DNA-binding beta-propeller fold protein YncE